MEFAIYRHQPGQQNSCLQFPVHVQRHALCDASSRNSGIGLPLLKFQEAGTGEYRTTLLGPAALNSSNDTRTRHHDAEAGHCDDDGARSRKGRAVHFNALRQLYGPSSLGMREGAPVERCSSEHSKRNLVSRLCRCKAADARTNEGDGQISRRQMPFRTLSQ